MANIPYLGKPGKSTVPYLVVRFPDGSWSSGGNADDPDYSLCEKFWVERDPRFDIDGHKSRRKAQAYRSRQLKKQAVVAAEVKNAS
jgi:hypothetical protein